MRKGLAQDAEDPQAAWGKAEAAPPHTEGTSLPCRPSRGRHRKDIAVSRTGPSSRRPVHICCKASRHNTSHTSTCPTAGRTNRASQPQRAGARRQPSVGRPHPSRRNLHAPRVMRKGPKAPASALQPTPSPDPPMDRTSCRTPDNDGRTLVLCPLPHGRRTGRTGR